VNEENDEWETVFEEKDNNEIENFDEIEKLSEIENKKIEILIIESGISSDCQFKIKLNECFGIKNSNNEMIFDTIKQFYIKLKFKYFKIIKNWIVILQKVNIENKIKERKNYKRKGRNK
jgi:hypothetical protein